MENFLAASSTQVLSHPRNEPVWNVPSRLTSFVGREREIQQICTLMQNPQVRILTIIGTAGVGKTSLSIQAASKLKDKFADGIYFISLSSVQDPKMVLDAFAYTLNLTVKGEHPMLEQVTHFLLSKDILLILDNFEHVISATSVIEVLLQSCSQLKLLVTSRTVLYVQGEHEYLVRPLPIPSENMQFLTKKRLLAHDAVVLFLQRASAILPTFELTQENAEVIAQICRRLDGLPLAIELAAARTKMFPPHVLLSKLTQRFTLLTSGTHPGHIVNRLSG